MKAQQSRFGAYAHGDMLPMIDEFCEKFGIARAAFTEIFVAGLVKSPKLLLTNEQIAEIITAGKAHIKATRGPDGRSVRGKLLAEVQRLSVTDLERVLKQHTPKA